MSSTTHERPGSLWKTGVRKLRDLLSGAPTGGRPFTGSRDYWEQRYAEGGDSGVGSYGKFREFKASFLNDFVARNGIRTVIELGCGDGSQLELAEYPSYTGFDVSPTAVARCRERFAGDETKTFRLMGEHDVGTADLALSLDVLYHLVEDAVFASYMQSLFGAAERYVIIYSSNCEPVDAPSVPHVRHREFTDWVTGNMPGWMLLEQAPNPYPYAGDFTQGTRSEFFVYARDSV
jgi:SAM-dependent methyltransferase